MSLTPFIPNPVSKTVVGLTIDALASLARNASVAVAQASLGVEIVAGAEGTPSANDRVFTFQPLSSSRQKCRGVFPLLVWLSDAEGGAPAGTQTTAWTTGNVLFELAANKAWLVLTAATGIAELKVNVSGAGTRYPHAITLPPAVSGGPVAWEA